MNKFGRKYRLTVDMNDGTGQIVIEPPLTIQFSVERSTNSSMNTMLLIIYNLGEVTRNRIFQDFFVTDKYRRVTLEAGYGDDLSTIFTGNIRSSSSARQGVNILTTINAFDGGFDTQTTMSKKTLVEGTSYIDMFKNLIGDFPNINQGKIGNIEGSFRRPVVLDGNTFDLIRRYTNNQVYIDLQQINILKDNEVIDGVVPLIDSSTGLLETPRRENAFLTVTTLFEPKILMAQILELQSSIVPIYNGQYKVVGIKHQGTISDAVGGDLTTEINLLLGEQYFGRFVSVK